MKIKTFFALGISIFALSCTKQNEDSILNIKVEKIESKASLRVAAASLNIGGANISAGSTYFVKGGQWQGNVNSKGNYYLDYVINTYDNSDANNYWIITGSNFTIGDSQGKGNVISDSKGITFDIISWGKDKASGIQTIKVRPKATYLLDTKKNVSISVTNYLNQTCHKTINIIGMIQNGRGYGQCTWEVAYQRLLMSKTVPSSAYMIGLKTDANYTPEKGDVLFWSKSHTAIILDKPIRKSKYSSYTKDNIKYDSLITYTFTLQERNYKYDEVAGSSLQTFIKRKNKAGTQILVDTGISSQAASLGKATDFWKK